MSARRVVLVVDDESITRDVVQAMLELEHVAVHTAADAAAALALAEEVRPDLVLLDVMMPGMDGIEVCRLLAARPDAPRVVMLTARADDTARRAAAEAGAVGYLVKPFSAVDLFAVVDEEPVRGA
ncbi:MAG TPA: response regulator [Frankiaceae bacterium]|nr:response regulator [Frankiaceae bacterium]